MLRAKFAHISWDKNRGFSHTLEVLTSNLLDELWDVSQRILTIVIKYLTDTKLCPVWLLILLQCLV